MTDVGDREQDYGIVSGEFEKRVGLFVPWRRDESRLYERKIAELCI